MYRGTKETVIQSKAIALAIARASSDKKALDIVTIHMKKVPSVCDYFVIASGTSTTQVRAISDHIREKLQAKGEKLWHIEGEREGMWILLDFGDVVAHVFLDETRRFYDLERLWADCRQYHFKEAARPPAKPKKKAALRMKKAPGKRRKAARRKR